MKLEPLPGLYYAALVGTLYAGVATTGGAEPAWGPSSLVQPTDCAGPVAAGAHRHSSDHTQRRAGCPQCISWHAIPTNTKAYVGYYVGGGSVCLRDPPCANEGTWGWDYQGWFFPRRIVLNWWHGRRYQGGMGYYRTVPEANLASPSTP